MKNQRANYRDLTQTNPTLALANYPHRDIADALRAISDFTYVPDARGTFAAREAIAKRYAEDGVLVHPEQLFLTASTSEAYVHLFKLLCDPQDAVLSPLPSYPLFEHLAALASVEIRPYRLLYDGSWHIDFDHLRSQIDSRSKALLVVHPNNPTGHFLTGEERRELLRLAQEHRLPVISDEVFLSYPFKVAEEGARSLAGESDVPTFVLNGLSKGAGMPQVKLAWIATGGPAEFRRASGEILEMMTDIYLSVGAPVQLALDQLLTTGDKIGTLIRNQVATNWQFLNSRIRESAMSVLHAEGGWSGILRMPATLDDEAWVLKFIDESGTVTQPGYYFDLLGGSYIVVSLLTPPQEFTAGIEDICGAAD